MPKSKLSDHYRHKIETELSVDEFDPFISLCNRVRPLLPVVASNVANMIS